MGDGRNAGFATCWNCGAIIGKQLLDEEHYKNTCPLCDATDILSDG